MDTEKQFLIKFSDVSVPHIQVQYVDIYTESLEKAHILFREMFPSEHIKIESIYESVREKFVSICPTEMGWVRNIQLLRVEFPILSDSVQDNETRLLVESCEKYLRNRFAGEITDKLIVCSDGFFRADYNWDNIDEPNRCVNRPTRGSGENEP